MGKLLEKVIDDEDLIVMGVTAGLTLIGTGIYAAFANINGVGDVVDISAPIPWSTTYLSTLKTFGEAVIYSLPTSAVVGYIGSKILKKVR